MGSPADKPKPCLRRHCAAVIGCPQLERDESSDLPADAPHTVIWGTDINAAVVERKVHKFLTNYTGDEPLPSIADGPRGKYARLLRQVVDNGEPMLNIDCGDIIASGDELLYSWLVQYPREVIPIFDQEVSKLAQDAPQMHVWTDGVSAAHAYCTAVLLAIRPSLWRMCCRPCCNTPAVPCAAA